MLNSNSTGFVNRLSQNVRRTAEGSSDGVFERTLPNKADQVFERMGHGKMTTTSHVNLEDILEYNNKSKKQRPLTSKVKSLSSSQGGGNRIMSAHRRLTSAKGDSRNRFRTNKSGADTKHALTNTRDVIQSYGHLTTMAGTNYEQVHSSAQGPAPIVRQHFVPNHAQKRLQSAKYNQMSQASMFRTTTRKSSTHNQSQPKMNYLSHRPKSSVPQSRHKRNQAALVAQGEQLVPLPAEPAHFTEGNSQINLAVQTGKPPVAYASQPARRNAARGHNRTFSHQKRRNPATASTTMAPSTNVSYINRTIYRLPSLSQCIENNILPRSSEYMKRLYSIASRNHETQVQQIIQQQMMANQHQVTMSPVPQADIQIKDIHEADRDTVNFSNFKEQQTLQLMNQVHDVELKRQLEGQQQAPDQRRNSQPEQASTTQHKRTESCATLKVQNLQFPFDQQTQGGFSLAKQREIQVQSQVIEPHDGDNERRRRPQTAGRMRQGGPEIFNNTLISSLAQGGANHQSSPALSSLLQQNASYIQIVPQNPKANLNILRPGNHTQDIIDGSVQNKFNLIEVNALNPIISPRTQFSQLLNQVQQGTAQIVMCVQPKGQIDGVGGGPPQFQLLTTGAAATQLISDDNRSVHSHMTNTSSHLEINDGNSRKVESQPSEHIMNALENERAEVASAGAATRPPDIGFSHFVKESRNMASIQSNDLLQVRGEAGSTQLIVKMQNQHAAKKKSRQESARNGSFDGNSMGSSGRLRGSKRSQKPGRVSSTHSLKVSMPNRNTQHSKRSDHSSKDGTNRLEESDMSPEGRRNDTDVKRSGAFQIDEHSDRDLSEEGHYSTLHVNKLSKAQQPQGMPQRQSYPLKAEKQNSNQESHVSLQSQSQNAPDMNVNMQQVYSSDESKVIHKIPQPAGPHGMSAQSLPSGQESSRKQVLYVTKEKTIATTLAASGHNAEVSISNMSNPLNSYQVSERMKPIKIRSIIFEKNKQGANDYQKIREVPRGYSIIEQQNAASDHKQSSTKIKSPKHGAAASSDRLRSPRAGSMTNRADDEPTPLQLEDENDASQYNHKKFRVTMHVRRFQTRKESQIANPPQPAPVKGKTMKLQSARHQRSKKKHSLKDCQHPEGQVSINLIKRDAENDSALNNFGLAENSKATVHNVPPLALPPSETATDFLQVSLLQSSQRHLGASNMHLTYSNSSFQNKTLGLGLTENQKALNSFHANNVRANLKGPNASRLIQGIDLGKSQQTNTVQEKPKAEKLLSLSAMNSAMHSPMLNKGPALRQSSGKKRHPNHINNLTNNEESRRSLERMLIGNGAEQAEASDQNMTSQRDFSATLLNHELQLNQSKSDSEEKVMESIVQPKFEDNQHRGDSDFTSMHLPSALNNLDIPEKPDIIQEQIDESEKSRRSKRTTSAASLRKTDNAMLLIKVEQDYAPGQQTTSMDLSLGQNRKYIQPRMKLSNQEVFSNKIKSVYEAEAQALKRGLIKAYSGRGDMLRSNRQNAMNDNSDLQHFLVDKNKSQTPTIDVMTQRWGSTGKNDTQNSLVKSQKTLQQSQKFKQSSASFGGGVTRNSQVSLMQQSSLGLNITQIGKHREGKKSVSPSLRSMEQPTIRNQASFDTHQQEAHTVLKEAKRLILEAKVHKIDAEVLNQQLLALFQNQRDQNKHINLIMEKATQELGTQTLTSGKRKTGLEIPFQISQPVRLIDSKNPRARSKEAATIMTNKLSTSTMPKAKESMRAIWDVNKNTRKETNFTPLSPTSQLSSTRQAHDTKEKSKVASFAINSLGASTNRISTTNLPHFGGVISRRSNHIDQAVYDSTKKSSAYFRTNESLEVNPAPSHTNDYAVTGNSGNVKHVKGVAPIIDYSKNVIPSPRDQAVSDSQEITIHEKRKPSTHLSSKAGHRRNPSGHKKKRPQTASRYNTTCRHVDPNINKDLVHTYWDASLPERQVATQRIKKNWQMGTEHTAQPIWAVQRNLKSKFNLASSKDQARQQQKFLIDFTRKTTFEQDRVTTQVMGQQMSPQQTMTLAKVDASIQQDARKISNISSPPVEAKAMESTQERLRAMKKILSMPIAAQETTTTNIAILVEGEDQMFHRAKPAAASDHFQIQELDQGSYSIRNEEDMDGVPQEEDVMEQPNMVDLVDIPRVTNESSEILHQMKSAGFYGVQDAALQSNENVQPIPEPRQTLKSVDDQQYEDELGTQTNVDDSVHVIDHKMAHVLAEDSAQPSPTKTMNNQSLQVSLMQEAADVMNVSDMQRPTETQNILQRYIRSPGSVQIAASVAEDLEQIMNSNHLSSASQMRSSHLSQSQRSARNNSRKFLEKRPDQGYIGMSQAKGNFFSVSRNIIGSSHRSTGRQRNN